MANWEVDYSYSVREGATTVVNNVDREDLERVALEQIHADNELIDSVEIDGIREIKRDE
jgi:hypothetical protein